MMHRSPTERFTHAPTGSHRSCAFTLVELVVVIVIMAIMASVAIPRYASAASRYRVDAAVQQIIADVNTTSAVANLASESRVIRFDADEDSYTLVGQPSLNNPAIDQVVDLSVEPFKANLLQISFGGDSELQISGFGLLLESGQLTVASGRNARRITFAQGSTTATVVDLTLNEPTDDESIDVGGTGSTRTFNVGGATAQATGGL